jgi:serine/threonine-protein kinase
VAANGFDDDPTRSFTQLAAGTKVSHYTIISKIGAGGMGEVYLAVDNKLSRNVALKFLPNHLCQNEDARSRFMREAKAVAKLDHPNVVPIHEVDEFQSRPFFALAYIEGKSLKEVIREGKLTVEQCVDFTMQICEGLHLAHESGVVHRDVKPGNIVIDRDNKARILDFGLATISGEEKLTKTGSTLGTVGYMSPEQITGKEINHRTDIFSVGVILYEMLTGRRPFEGDNDAAIVYAISHEAPKPLESYKAGVSKEMQRIIDKALAKNPQMRYQQADDIIVDLNRLQLSANTDTTKSLRKMLAVLPFANLGSPDDEYFADGITDEIISKLARIGELGVISRTSIIQFKNTNKKMKEIGAELGVEYVLEGTIRWNKSTQPSRIRVHSQLIRVQDDIHLWSETTDTFMVDVFKLQADIAENVVRALGITILEKENKSLRLFETSNEKAYECVLKGLQFYSRAATSDHDMRLALAMFKKAQHYDPLYARAFAWESIVHSAKFHWGHVGSEGGIKRAEKSADMAYHLSPHHSDTHLALGYFHYFCKRDYYSALSEFRIASSISPGSYENYLAMAYVQRRMSLYDEALLNFRKARDVSPLEHHPYFDIGITYSYLRKYQEAEQWLNRAIALAPDIHHLYNQKIFLYFYWKGDPKLARSVLNEMSDIFGADETLWERGFIEAAEGRYEKALETFIRMKELKKKDDLNANLEIAHLYRILGSDKEAQEYYKYIHDDLKDTIETSPDDCRNLSLFGVALAGIGESERAVEYGRRATSLCTMKDDSLAAPMYIVKLAEIYTINGQFDLAVEQLDQLLSTHNVCSIESLRLFSSLYTLHKHPLFNDLVEKYEKPY